MKAVCTLFFVLLSVGVAAPAAASPAVPTPALPDMTSVWLNAAVAAPVAAWPWDSEQPGSFLVFPYFRTGTVMRSEEHTSELQSQSNLVCRLLLEKKKNNKK